MIYKDETYNFFIANSEINPLCGNIPSIKRVKKAVEPMILSASGWRKIFVESGDEEDNCPNISLEDKYIASFIALSLAKHLGCVENCSVIENNKKTVLLGMDARPTGPELCDVIARVLLACNIEVKNLFIASAPEIMAYSNLKNNEIDAFLYISASHNPIGHNGVKFGVNGGVYTGSETALLINDFKEFINDKKYMEFTQKLVSSLKRETYDSTLQKIPTLKKESLKLYRQFALQTAAKDQNIEEFLLQLKTKLKEKPLGIIAELNGSARAYTIDKDFFQELGIKSVFKNDVPRQVVHAIVPEGENLELCRSILEEKYKEDPTFCVGYVPDNDGDRGNLVYIKKSTGKAVILQAQEVFALVLMAELSGIRRDNPQDKLAVSVNGPTSMRIDEICKALNVEIFRTEVGEGNVVELAQVKRDEGYIVRILGEGSNGGNITAPAKVRDPLNTIMTLVSILSDPSIFEVYQKSINYKNSELSIENLINSLPIYRTTDAFSKEAKLQVLSSHKDLKANYEKEFVEYFEKNNLMLRDKFGIYSYTEYQMEGIKCLEGMGINYRTSPYKGGLKIVLNDQNKLPIAFIWMRGSGTEPVFRILVDCKGDNKELYNFLLNLHTNLIVKAD